ncbi:MAG: LacI family DNA-binding transcriptional regulator [Acidimicrobiia bacterium]|nr:LacI family DNA-binding transcriptional regulator [Acidimicrobiia bacterium]
MSPTISDVANAAGVSTATVSRALSGSPRVAPDTMEKVLASVAELGYQPSAIARSLRQQKTTVLGVIVTDITNPFYGELVLGAEEAALDMGLSVLLCNAAGDSEREAQYLDVLAEQRVGGVIVASEILSQRYRERLADFPVPVVLVNTKHDGAPIPSVTSDNRRGGQLAAQHLVDQGYPSVAAILGPTYADGRPLRVVGIRDVVDGDRLVTEAGTGDMEGGRRAMERLARRISPPFGLVCHNDLTAIGAMSVLRKRGWRVPEDVGVVGFDDIPISAYVDPPLTTVAQDMYALGARAVDALHRISPSDGADFEEILEVRLVVRESSIRGGS